MKRLLITVSALSLLAAPTLSLAQDGGRRGGGGRGEQSQLSDEEREARRAARQAERQAQGGGGEEAQSAELQERREERQDRREERVERREEPVVDSELQRRDAAARAMAEENARRQRTGEEQLDWRDRGDRREAYRDARGERPGERQERREDRRDDRQDRHEDRRDDRRDDRQDARQDRREDRRDDRRDDRRYERQRERSFNWRGRDYRAYRAQPYRWAPGFRLRSWGVGAILPPPLISQSYVLRNYWDFGLPPPPRGTWYVRVDTDVYLVTQRGGRVIDVIPGVFYYDDYGYGY